MVRIFRNYLLLLLSTWNTIILDVNVLKSQGVDLISHCKKRVGNGVLTRFWSDFWLGDKHLRLLSPRIFALEANKDCIVATKLQGSVDLSIRRHVRGEVESHKLDQLQELVGSTILTYYEDRWYWDLNGNGVFCVKDVCNMLDASFLPKDTNATRWIKSIPIKINVFAWKVYLDRLPTRLNLLSWGVYVSSLLCPICISDHENTSHLLLVVSWLLMWFGLFVDGGIWFGRLLVRTLNGCLGSILSD